MLVVLFAIVMYTDFRWLRIPNVFTYPTMAIGIVLGAVEGFPGGLTRSSQQPARTPRKVSANRGFVEDAH